MFQTPWNIHSWTLEMMLWKKDLSFYVGICLVSMLVRGSVVQFFIHQLTSINQLCMMWLSSLQYRITASRVVAHVRWLVGTRIINFKQGTFPISTVPQWRDFVMYLKVSMFTSLVQTPNGSELLYFRWVKSTTCDT